MSQMLLHTKESKDRVNKCRVENVCEFTFLLCTVVGILKRWGSVTQENMGWYVLVLLRF